MEMKKLNTNWVVMKVTNRSSQYGNVIQEVTFANTYGEIAHTYLDEDNVNYARWRDIVEAYDRGYGVVVSGLKLKRNAIHKKTGEPLVNADSLVRVVHVEENLQDLLDEFVAELTR